MAVPALINWQLLPSKRPPSSERVPHVDKRCILESKLQTHSLNECEHNSQVGLIEALHLPLERARLSNADSWCSLLASLTASSASNSDATADTPGLGRQEVACWRAMREHEDKDVFELPLAVPAVKDAVMAGCCGCGGGLAGAGLALPVRDNLPPAGLAAVMEEAELQAEVEEGCWLLGEGRRTCADDGGDAARWG